MWYDLDMTYEIEVYVDEVPRSFDVEAPSEESALLQLGAILADDGVVNGTDIPTLEFRSIR